VVRCPICTKNQLVYVQGPKLTSCYYCGAHWVQQGDEQEGIIELGSPRSAMQSLQLQSTTKETT